MELTPEERQRIYEEEKVRVEGGYRPLTNEERARLSTPPAIAVKPSFGIGAAFGWLVIAVTLGGTAIVVRAIFVPPTPAVPTTDPALAAYEKTLAALTEKISGAEVQPGWKWEIDGEYDHLRGSVKNKSTRTVRYWAVTAKFVKKGQEVVIDSAFTNDGQPLLPGESKQFEIMHRNLPGTVARIETTDVRFAD